MNCHSTSICVNAADAARMPNAAWAWEYLRRNEDYLRSFNAARLRREQAVELNSGARLIRARRRWRDAEDWGLLAFADPSKSALETEVFWSPDLLAGALPIQMFRPGDNPEIAHDEIVMSALKTRRVLLDTVDGARHILLNGPRFWVQLHCRKPAARGDFAALAISIDGAKHYKRRLDTANQLLALYQSTGAKLSLIGRSKDTTRLSQGLVAYDMKSAGCSNRDVAEAVFGREKVAQRWGAPSQYFEDRTRRLVARARTLVEGGYRGFLTRKSL